jgi:hypothetical protein
VDEDLRAQVKARRVSRGAQAWRARARVMWTRLFMHKKFSLLAVLFYRDAYLVKTEAIHSSETSINLYCTI